MKTYLKLAAFGLACLLVAWATKDVRAQTQGGASGVLSVSSSSAETCHQMKVGPGLLYSVGASAGASALFIYIVDTATTPANGTVVSVIPPQAIAVNGSMFLAFFDAPIRFGTGLFVCGSTTGQVTFGGSATGTYSAQVQ